MYTNTCVASQYEYGSIILCNTILPKLPYLKFVSKIIFPENTILKHISMKTTLY